MKMKKALSFVLAISLLAGCQTKTNEETKTLKAPEDNVELYLAAREISTNMAAYDSTTMGKLQDILIMDFDLMPTVKDNLEMIANPDEQTQEKLDKLREAYNAVVQTKDINEVVYDIYEGHDVLPVVGKVIDNESTQQACLTDLNDHYRPVLNTYLLDKPKEAIGTILAVPSVRGAHNETRDYAEIFNAKGYNVITLEPRFNHVEEDQRTYYLMNLDCLRAIRYIKAHASEFKIDENKLIVVAGSKGNYAHMMSTLYFDMTPSEYANHIGVELNNYEEDEIDNILANVQVQIWSYGNMFAVDTNDELTLDDFGLYSKEYYEQGIQLPAMVFVGGTLDAGVTNKMPNVMNALIKFNSDEDRLYDIPWEMHEFYGVPHGF